MLCELAVQNLALIEDVRVELHSGFCAWTGETGAGKTLLLEALGLLLGERGSADLLRAGCDELRIAGRFQPPAHLRPAIETIVGVALQDDDLILTRRLSRAGRSFAYVNEQPVTVATLRQLGAVLVNIHGQRESLSLLEPAYQLQLLDAFGDLDAPRQRYLLTAEQVRELRRRYAALVTQQQQRQRELALLAFERDELDAASLVPGELQQLAQERERLMHTQALQEFAAGACGRLYDEEGAVFEQLGKTAHEAEGWKSAEPELVELAAHLQSLATETQDIARELRDLAQRWQADPERLEQVEERLQLLRRLEAKYRRPVDELLAYRLTLDEQYQLLQKQESDLSTIEEELRQQFAELRQAGADLSQKRQGQARKLATAVQRQLADLGMADAQLDARLEPVPLGDDPTRADIPALGFEQLELLLAANRGEPARPLRKVASGGELSRTMLGLKTVLAAHDQVPTLVFDEIDANVGGRLGDVLGQKLAALGRTHQVICVTHLPQVASFARHQWSIRKIRRGKRTTTTIQLLGEGERLEELASMLRGEARGETTRQEAAAMLEAARRCW